MKKLSINHRFNCLDEITRYVRSTGSYFFDAESMRFFNAKTYETIYFGRFFITSEKCSFGGGHPRKYTVRSVGVPGSIETIGAFNSFNTKAQAERFIRKYLSFEHAKLIDLHVMAYNTGRHLKAVQTLRAKHPEVLTNILDLELQPDWVVNFVTNRIENKADLKHLLTSVK